MSWPALGIDGICVGMPSVLGSAGMAVPPSSIANASGDIGGF